MSSDRDSRARLDDSLEAMRLTLDALRRDYAPDRRFVLDVPELSPPSLEDALAADLASAGRRFAWGFSGTVGVAYSLPTLVTKIDLSDLDPSERERFASAVEDFERREAISSTVDSLVSEVPEFAGLGFDPPPEGGNVPEE